MHAWSTSMLMLLHSAFMLSRVKMLLKGEVGGRALNSHGNYIVDYGKSWKNHGIVIWNFCENPDLGLYSKLIVCGSSHIGVSGLPICFTPCSSISSEQLALTLRRRFQKKNKP